MLLKASAEVAQPSLNLGSQVLEPLSRGNPSVQVLKFWWLLCSRSSLALRLVHGCEHSQGGPSCSVREENP